MTNLHFSVVIVDFKLQDLKYPMISMYKTTVCFKNNPISDIILIRRLCYNVSFAVDIAASTLRPASLVHA